MCGIIGYVGMSDVVPILLQGLRRLEYRGYDSAGLAVLTPQGGLRVVKEAGKIAALEALLNGNTPRGSCGVAHTRWATHGAPSRMNAHPHVSGALDIALVHNGIIENAPLLKKRLLERGYTFRSETDTEVLVHLIDEAFQWNLTLEEAVAAALHGVEGTYGIAVVSLRDPGKIVAARQGSPLLLGVGEGETLVASDAAALVARTRNIVYLSDGDVAVLTPGGVTTLHLDGTLVSRPIHRVEWDLGAIEKGGFPHFMLKEIFEQPATLRDVMRGRLVIDEGGSRLGGLKEHEAQLAEIRRIVITACGTSWHAALLGELMLEEMARIPTEVEYASEFRYKNPVLDGQTLVMAVSQSGETADTLAALREAKRRGSPTMGVVNVVGSTIARETDFGIYLHAGPEIGVASTKAFTSQVVALALVALYLGRRRGLALERGRELIRALERLPGQVEEVLELDQQVRMLAAEFAGSRNFLYLGRGYQFPVALEGALKLKEVSYIHAEGYPAAEMKHGPIALIDQDMPVVFLAPSDPVYPKILSNIEEVKARGGRVIAVATRGNESMRGKADYVLYVPETHPVLLPVLTVVPLQLLAYHAAVLRGCDVDQPRNLAKSVTVE